MEVDSSRNENSAYCAARIPADNAARLAAVLDEAGAQVTHRVLPAGHGQDAGHRARGDEAVQAAEKVVVELKKRAAMIWDISPEAVEWKDGKAYPAGPNAGSFEPLSLQEIALKAGRTGGPISAEVTINAQGAGAGWATHICDVEVDRETGHVKILRYTAVQDVGRAIHPSYVEGQVQGGVTQGIGWALNEEYVYDKQGRLDNPGFLDYRIPVASDLPMIETIIVEVPNPNHPYGVKGVLFPFSLASRLDANNLFNQSIGEFVSPFSLGLSDHFPFFARLPLVFAFRGLAILFRIGRDIGLRGNYLRTFWRTAARALRAGEIEDLILRAHKTQALLLIFQVSDKAHDVLQMKGLPGFASLLTSHEWPLYVSRCCERYRSGWKLSTFRRGVCMCKIHSRLSIIDGL